MSTLRSASPARNASSPQQGRLAFEYRFKYLTKAADPSRTSIKTERRTRLADALKFAEKIQARYPLEWGVLEQRAILIVGPWRPVRKRGAK